jgi:glycerophosphoryl diester phosphodiesterase
MPLKRNLGAAACALALLCSMPFSALAQNRSIIAIAHRGEHLEHPENTLPAIQAAIDLGFDYAELDVRTTADGKLILMHDPKVNRMTNGKGEVSKLTLEEIRKLDAGVKFGPQLAGTKVPTFQEGLEAVRGKMGIYVHIKDAAPKQLIDLIDSEQMMDHVVFFCEDISYLKKLQALRPDARVMPEAVNLTKLKKTIDEMHPRFIAMEAADFHDDIVAAAKQSGAAIFVDRFDDADAPQGWQNAIDRNADGIQTNRPAELIKFLRSKGYHP